MNFIFTQLILISITEIWLDFIRFYYMIRSQFGMEVSTLQVQVELNLDMVWMTGLRSDVDMVYISQACYY